MAAVGIIRDNKTLDTIIMLCIILVTLRQKKSVDIWVFGFTDSYLLKVYLSM